MGYIQSVGGEIMDLTSLLDLYRQYLSFTANRKNIRADITLLVEGGDSVVFPIPPADLPTVTSPQNNDVFNSIIGDVSIMGLLGLRDVNFDDFKLPAYSNDYSYAKGDSGSDIINFINENRQKGQPFRLIITKDDYTYLNMSVLIDTFDYYLDNSLWYHLNATFKEYRTFNQQTGGLSS